MLPILRTISVGGVLLAITILALALSPPGGSHMQFTAVDAPARGALIDAREHPEWRQFIIQAALRRADELNRLRELPDVATRRPETPPDISFAEPDYTPAELLPALARDAPKTVGLQAGPNGTDLEDVTGTIDAASDTTIPIDIGAPSSTELPVTPEDDKPPVIRSPLTQTPDPAETPTAKISTVVPPEPIKPAAKPTPKKVQRHHARPPTKPAEPQVTVPIPFNILQALFETLAGKPVIQPAAEKRRAVRQKQPAVIGAISQQ